MAFITLNVCSKINLKQLEEKLINLSLQSVSKSQARGKLTFQRPRLRNPTWFTKKNRVLHNDYITPENEEFLKDVVSYKYQVGSAGIEVPLTKGDSSVNNAVVSEKDSKRKIVRTGLIAKKIGNYPLWLKNGKQVRTTLLQVLDNQVVKYYTPEEYDGPRKRVLAPKRRLACLLVGAEATDPSLFTKEYCGLFTESGIMPKRHLARFFVSPEAVLPLGAQLSVTHFRPGDYVDVRGLTIDRGFQGVMKRWGFSGMPASHGVTKTHRRPGNIGGGGEKGRVWPGKKMPGHMGNRWRVARGLRIWRVNTRYNVMWVQGTAIPGATNHICYIYDTLLPRRRPQHPLIPTAIHSHTNQVLDDLYDPDVHPFQEPTILFE